MIVLALSVLFSVGFGHVMKWANDRRANVLWVGAWNYIGAATVCLAMTLAVAHPTHRIAFTITTGAWAGVCYLVSLLFYFAAVARVGVGLASAVNRLSVALPVVAAVAVWHEQVTGAQVVALVLVAVALPLLGSDQTGSRRGTLALLSGILAPLFVITGLGQLAARIYSGGAPATSAFLYLTALFTGAAVSALVALGVRPVRLHRRDVGLGLLLGAVNVGANLCLLAALRALPSAVVFAVSSAAGVVLAAVSGVLIWRERLHRTAITGVALAAVAVVLLTR